MSAISTPWPGDSTKGPHGAADQGRCSARARSTGDRCGNRAMLGATVCRVHGGKAPQVMAKARRRLAVQEAEVEIRNAIAFEALDGIADPIEALAELASTALATERALAARVNDLAQDDRLRYRDDRGAEQLRAEVALWERWHKQASRLVEKLAGLNLEGRRVQLAEAQGALMSTIMRAVLAQMLAGVVQQLRSQGAGHELEQKVADHWANTVNAVVAGEIRQAMAEQGT